MSAASSAARVTTPTNQPERVRECPGAPVRPERPAGLTVEIPVARPLIFEELPSTPRKKVRKASKVYTEEDLKSISTALFPQ